jgi:uncharacterized protein
MSELFWEAEPMPKRVDESAWMEQLLSEEEVGHLASSDEGQPYVIPVNYAFLDGVIVIHCAMKGKKLDILRKNPKCSFAVNRHPDALRYHAEKRCHYRYHSVVVTGEARFVDTAEERLTWMRRFKQHFDERLDWTYEPPPDLAAARRCGIILIEVRAMSGRKVEGEDAKAHLAKDKNRPI